MLSEITNIIIRLRSPPVTKSVWDWSCANVDYSLNKRYRAAWPGKYNPELMPFWREPMEAFNTQDVKEIVVLACSQIGKSENMILNPIRWGLMTGNKAMLYVSAQMEMTEEFFQMRILRGLTVCAGGRARMNQLTGAGLSREIGDALVAATWSKSGQGLKGRAFDWCFGDEVSSWPDVAVVDEMRKRMATRPNSRLVLVSTPDTKQHRPSEEDPIFLEMTDSDWRRWVMPCPKTGNDFYFQFGGEGADYGLKWSAEARREDGSWDLDRVAETAYYLTPGGAVIENKDRREIIRRGRWMPTNKNGTRTKRGYHLNQFLLPFADGDFGYLARRWLQSRAKGPESMRSYFYEVLAEPWAEKVVVAQPVNFADREGGYSRGQLASAADGYRDLLAPKNCNVVLTIDVQKHCVFWVCRQWVDGGDSYLVDWGEAGRWEDVKGVALKYGASTVLIDNSYSGRRIEIFEQCVFGSMRGAIPAFGRDRLRKAFEAEARDPFEDTTRAGAHKIPMVTFQPDEFKNMLFELITGRDFHSWRIPKPAEKKYVEMMTSEICKDGKWTKTRQDNHWWDCEVMQLVAAVALGVFRQANMLADAEGQAASGDAVDTVAGTAGNTGQTVKQSIESVVVERGPVMNTGGGWLDTGGFSL